MTTTSIKHLLYSTIHRNKKSIEQLADEVGVSANSLYRYCLESESGSEMPLSRLLPLMRASKDYSLLKHIATLAGFLLVRMPRVTTDKKDEFDKLETYQSATIESVKSLKEFFNTPSDASLTKLNADLLKVMELCAQNKKYAEKKISGQLEINYGE